MLANKQLNLYYICMNQQKSLFPDLSQIALLAFLLSLAICSFMVSTFIISRTHNDTLQTEHFILEKSLLIEDTLSRLFYKAEILAAIIRHGKGSIYDFQGIAALIVDDPAILNVLIAPGGIVADAYSEYDDVSLLLGHNFFSDGGGNIEAVKAIESGELVMAGPFIGRQGYKVLAGRLPVFLDAEKTDLWGLVSVTLKFPEALDNAELGRLRMQGYEYELWRISPDTNEKQILDSNLKNAGANSRFVEKHIQFFNADWYLKLLATRSWYDYREIIFLAAAGLSISFLIFFIAQNNYRLKQTRAKLDILAKTDPLTGIFNRRHFAELVQMDMERARRFNENSYIILMDIDHFKNVNDTYGHSTGDKVLIEIARRMKETIRTYDILARYGGEEFIIYMPNTDSSGAAVIAERLRLKLCDNPCEFTEARVNITASFGVAKITESGIEKAIYHADLALYRAKEEGRNRVIFHTV